MNLRYKNDMQPAYVAPRPRSPSEERLANIARIPLILAQILLVSTPNLLQKLLTDGIKSNHGIVYKRP